MFAIFQTGGKQYKVSQNDVIYVEKLDNAAGETVTFNEVMAIDSEFGSPFVSGAKVVCSIEKHGKSEKLDIIHHRSQKHHTKRMGHRQPYTKLIVKEITR